VVILRLDEYVYFPLYPYQWLDVMQHLALSGTGPHQGRVHQLASPGRFKVRIGRRETKFVLVGISEDIEAVGANVGGTYEVLREEDEA